MAETRFNHDEYVYAYPDGIEHNFWNLARNRIILDWIKKIPHGKILDIGCGRGIVTDFLFRHGIPITGVELGHTTPISASKANIRYNTDALQLREDERTGFKTITLFDVLEHLPDPVKFIRELKSHFPSAEYLVLTVPARQELWSNFDEYYGHMQRYDLYMMTEELKYAGCPIIRQRYFFNSLYYAMRLNKVLKKSREIAFHPPKGISLMVHRVVGAFFYIESLLFSPKMKGSSIICIAKLR